LEKLLIGKSFGVRVREESGQSHLAIVVFSESTHEKRAAERCAFVVFSGVENGK
jgi:hypothetical protein